MDRDLIQSCYGSSVVSMWIWIWVKDTGDLKTEDLEVLLCFYLGDCFKCCKCHLNVKNNNNWNSSLCPGVTFVFMNSSLFLFYTRFSHLDVHDYTCLFGYGTLHLVQILRANTQEWRHDHRASEINTNSMDSHKHMYWKIFASIQTRNQYFKILFSHAQKVWC